MLTLFRHTNIAQMKWNSKNNCPDDFKKTKALRLLFFKGVKKMFAIIIQNGHHLIHQTVKYLFIFA